MHGTIVVSTFNVFVLFSAIKAVCMYTGTLHINQLFTRT